MEEWKPVIGFEDYEVSSFGRIKNKYGKFLNPTIDSVGYKMVGLWKDKKETKNRLHRIIAKTFLENPDNLPCVNHIDGDKTNNTIDNLEWCTYKDNNLHAYKIGLKKGSNKKPVICEQTGEVFDSIREAANKFCLNYGSLKSHLQGRSKTIKKLIFRFL